MVSPLLHAAHLKLSVAPAQAVTTGARWRVDGRAWQTTGTTLKSLAAGSHAIDHKTVTGWIVPAAVNVNLSGSGTTSLTGTYIQASALAVTLSPSAAIPNRSPRHCARELDPLLASRLNSPRLFPCSL